jgi:hypothetical protein
MKKPVVFLSLFLVLGSCGNKQNETEGQIVSSIEPEIKDSGWIDPNKIEKGPVMRDELTKEQLEKIDILLETFKEVDPTPKEQWIEDFKRDQNPDREIEIWLMMATAYNSFVKEKKPDLDTKKEVFQVVLLRSGASEEETLSHMHAKHLSTEDIKKIMKAYTLEAKPVRVMSK